MFAPLNFPPANLRIQGSPSMEVFDVVRKKQVALTPEEWVRQHILHFLIDHKHFPAGLIEVEKGIQLFNTYKRVDILVRSRDLKPLLLVECKAPEVSISQNEVNQLARYQITLQAPYSMLSNGVQHIILHHADGKIVNLTDLPDYSQLGS